MIKRRCTVDYHTMETMLHDMYDGQTPVVLIEVFGPPEEMSYDPREDSNRGPWYVGEKAEVLAFALECGYPYDIQYEIDIDVDSKKEEHEYAHVHYRAGCEFCDDEQRDDELCPARARKGTGEGTCDRPLDSHGQCDRAGDHI